MIVNKINKELLELLQNTQPANKTYRQHLAWLFEEYLHKLSFYQPEWGKYCLIAEPTEDIIEGVQKSCDKLLAIYDLYMQGKIGDAVDEMVMGFMTSESIFREELTSQEPLFRARTIESYQGSYDAREMFHVPFEKRGKIANNRFSIAGFPCLYMGKSILACWEEMHKPNIDNLCVSKVAIEESESRFVIDLTWKEDLDSNISEDEEEQSMQYQDIITWLKRLPLIIACSIRVYDPAAPFKEEYVIPQMILLACIDNAYIDGVAYTSTRRDEQISADMELHKNYAFPVREIADEGYCKELVSVFDLTRGISFMEAEIKNVFHARGMQVMRKKGVVMHIKNMDKGKSEYECTKFGQMEEYLSSQPFYCIFEDKGEWKEQQVKVK